MKNNKAVGFTVVVAIMAAAAAVGRIAFAAIPDFKPTTAIIIIAGLSLGRRAGFLTGALAAFASNFYFGHGVWTPFQMLAWGVVGLLAGALSKTPLKKRLLPVVFLGIFSAYFYGIIMNTYHIAFFVRPFAWQAAVAAMAASIYFDSVHAVSTAVFLSVLARPWLNRLDRIKMKFDL